MKSKNRLYLTILITIILAIAFLGVMVKMIKENGKCADDPFRYSAIKLKESGGNYACYCKSLDQNLLDFSFSEDGIEIMKFNDFTKSYNYSAKYPKLNTSNINISK